ncbi:proton myo-inositol cotransporter [Exaiptasia diaphana]|uniref:Major facilitator superfamily (MFS) profile domain-containing protein n=1 Tax=Exaiptasia diaphana TaxID=2652724 RepID=A0A913XTB8_EXADI|nr:proton myo-inositol cotransporter [Exaiptasia diaphana]KXJ09304.1 Proton myo-inositol cotransporter [Exaiptasia diaphana]
MAHSSTDNPNSLQSDKEESSEREVLISHTRASSNFYVYLLTCFAAIGGFLFGYDTGVVSGAMLLLKTEFSLSQEWQELVVSITIGTAIFGAVVAGYITDKLGRRPFLWICSAIFTAGAVLMAVAESRDILVLGRAIVGLGIGGASMTVPLYIAETTPASVRGKLVTMNNGFITGGQFVASIIDGIFANVHQGWRYMLGLAAVPSLILFIGCIFLPESPRWLIKHNHLGAARKALKKLRGTIHIEEEVQGIIAVCQEEETLATEQGKQNCVSILKDPTARRALLLGCMLQAVQQLSGINTLMYYSATIIVMSGIGTDNLAIWLAAAVAFGNFLFTIVGMFLVEKIGRRKLLLGSLALVTLSLFLIGGAFYLIDINDPKVTFHEQASHCTSLDSCMQCVAKEDCGFCYNQNSHGYFTNGSCTFTNLSSHRALSGRCSNGQQAKWAYSTCPSHFAVFSFVGMILYIASFAPGMGPMPWTLNSEIFPLWARSKGIASATAVNWICNLIIALTFLNLMEWITRYGAFWLYGSIAFAGWVFFYFMVPETKGKSLEQLETIMAPKR